MLYSKSGLHLTEQFEGCKLQAYQDSGGVWTIGYGHTRSVVGGMVCTQEQAIDWLNDDIEVAQDFINHVVTCSLNQEQFDALVDFVFNCGCMAFLHSTMLYQLNLKHPNLAALEFDKWCHCDGKVIAGLLRRREAETAEFEGTHDRETA